MPFLSSVKCKVQSAKSKKLTNHFSLFTNHFKVKLGFTLIEIVISLFIIIAIITILLTTSSVQLASRGSNLQGTAVKIASRQIETLRKTDYASLLSCPSPTGCTITDSDLAKLPSSSAKQFIDTYQGSPDVKQVTVQVTWVVGGAPKEIRLETLIYKNGL